MAIGDFNRPTRGETTDTSGRKLLWGLGAAGVLVVGFLVWTTLGGTQKHVESGRTAGPKAENTLATAYEGLYRKADLPACRGAVQQINEYLLHNPDKKVGLAADEAKFLSDRLDLDEEKDLRELGRGTFNALDAHYLEGCFLFQDAARSLNLDNLPVLEQAQAAFRWTTRQVRLQESSEGLLPPGFVLRRGWGTALERALVFLTLLNQIGIDGCMIGVPDREAGPAGVRYWAPGALVKDGEEDQIYLFDTRLGVPVPGRQGKGVATLADVRRQPDLLGALTVDPNYPYDVSADQVRSAAIYLVCPLSALAPRMRFLEEELANRAKVSLAADAAGLLKRFQDAKGGKGVEVRFWSRRGDPNTPTQALRAFLPPEQGGSDEAGRKQAAEVELIPWNGLPRAIRDLPANVDPGFHLRNLYVELFVLFPLPTKFREEAKAAGEVFGQAGGGAQGGAEKTASEDEGSRHLWQRFRKLFLEERAPVGVSADTMVPHLLSPDKPRDALLRGRLEEATTMLRDALDQVEFQEVMVRDAGADLGPRLSAWCAEAVRLYSEVQRLQRGRGAAGTEELRAQLPTEISQLWMRGGRPGQAGPVDTAVNAPVWLVGLVAGATPALSEAAHYQMALSKQEQAERAEGRRAREATGPNGPAAPKAWREAANWWSSYLERGSAGLAAPAARVLRARALLAQGKKDEARSLLNGARRHLEELLDALLRSQLGRDDFAAARQQHYAEAFLKPKLSPNDLQTVHAVKLEIAGLLYQIRQLR